MSEEITMNFLEAVNTDKKVIRKSWINRMYWIEKVNNHLECTNGKADIDYEDFLANDWVLWEDPHK